MDKTETTLSLEDLYIHVSNQESISPNAINNIINLRNNTYNALNKGELTYSDSQIQSEFEAFFEYIEPCLEILTYPNGDYKKIINHCATAPLLAKNLVEPNTLEEILTKEKTMFNKIKKSIFSKKLRAGEKVSHFKNANAQLNNTINELFPEGLQANNSMNN